MTESKIEAIIVTPVKNSINTTIDTIKNISNSSSTIHHIVYNDFSDEETKKTLEKIQSEYDFELVHLEDITDTPSPNYKLVLQDAQRRSLQNNLPLILVESDVKIEKDTFNRMLNFTSNHNKMGLIGAITTDEYGNINFPYLKFKGEKKAFVETKRSLSFCCTLLTLNFLKAYNFSKLDESKDWYDTFLSTKAIELGYKNYILLDTPVLHLPHGSRPWKKLKYTNPIKYYFMKLLEGRDKI